MKDDQKITGKEAALKIDEKIKEKNTKSGEKEREEVQKLKLGLRKMRKKEADHKEEDHKEEDHKEEDHKEEDHKEADHKEEDHKEIMKADLEYMKMALELAKRGCGYTAPNPMVGAVIVKEGRVIGQGWHEKYGDLHAERNALKSCKEDTEGATMYVTLEPCCHYGKQPPCVNAILDAKIRRVVVGSDDPNPLVNGKGIRILQEHGVEVIRHVLEEECDRLNEVFFHFVHTKRPFVVMKYAMTMDGKIATFSGASKWITGSTARNYVAWQRHRYSAIMVGVGTILADDPMLTCRIEGGKNPIRIICDSTLRTPLTANVVTTAKDTLTVLATCCMDQKRYLSYEEMGCQILCVKEKSGHVDLQDLMEKLGEKQIDSILLEGGAMLNWSAISAGIVQKVQTYIAPKLFGGENAKTPIEGAGVSLPAEAFVLKRSKIERLGEDLMIESEVDMDVYGNRGRSRNSEAH